MQYDIIIIGAGPGGIYSAYELTKENPGLKIAMFEGGNPLEKRHCPMEVEIDENLESPYKGLYIIGDGSGVTHSLSHASASGVYVARHILGTL